jgi:alpha-L-rhamnosidase
MGVSAGTAPFSRQMDLTLTVTIPPNTTATVFVPANDGGSVSEGGKPPGTASGVKFMRMDNGSAVCQVGSGEYRFAGTS